MLRFVSQQEDHGIPVYKCLGFVFRMYITWEPFLLLLQDAAATEPKDPA